MEPSTPSEVRGSKPAVRNGFAAVRSARVGAWLGAAILIFGLAASARAALQFDVFIGYGGQSSGSDGILGEAGWVAVSAQVQDGGPSFTAVFGLTPRPD